MSDSVNHYLFAITFKDDTVVIGTTAKPNDRAAMKACRLKVRRVLSKIRNGDIHFLSPFETYILNNQDNLEEADYFIHELRDNTIDVNEQHNRLRQNLIDEGWNMLTRIRKSTIRVR